MAKARLILVLMLVISLSVPFLAPAAPAQAAAAQQAAPARVRFVHASFDAPALDGYVDGVAVAPGVRANSGYMDLQPGEHTFSWRASGGAEDLASTSLAVESGQRVTIAALNTFANLEARAYIDDVSAPPRYTARVRVVHAVPDAGPVTVTAGDLTLASGLTYGEVSVTPVYAGPHDVVVMAEDGTQLAANPSQSFLDERTYTLFVVGTVASGAFRIITYESTVLPLEPTSLFRFAHMAAGAGPVNVHFNKEPAPLYSGVVFGNVQNSFAAGIGTHLVELYAPGTGPDNAAPLASGQFDIGPNEAVLFVAQGSADALEVGAYTADFSPVPPQSARLTVINLATGNPPFAVERMNGAPLLDAVDLYSMASTVVPAGSYNIRFKNPVSGGMMMEQGGVGIPAGTVTMMIALDDDPADQWVNAVTVPNEGVPVYAAVRWAHYNIFGPPVSVYMNGEPAVESLVYRMNTEYLLYPPGVYTLATYPVGADPNTAEPLFSDSIELTGDNFPRTIYVYGDPDQARLNVAPDSLELLPDGMARIRFVNAAIDAGGVAVYNSADNSVVAQSIPFGQASNNTNVSAGTYSFTFMADFGQVAALQAFEVEAGKVYTVVLGGSVTEQPGAEVFVLTATP